MTPISYFAKISNIQNNKNKVLPAEVPISVLLI